MGAEGCRNILVDLTLFNDTIKFQIRSTIRYSNDEVYFDSSMITLLPAVCPICSEDDEIYSEYFQLVTPNSQDIQLSQKYQINF